MPLHRQALQRQPGQARQLGREPRRRAAQAAQGGDDRGGDEVRPGQELRRQQKSPGNGVSPPDLADDETLEHFSSLLHF